MTEQWQALGSLHALWSALVIEELARLGVRNICVAPGSRSTPLTLAAAANPAITTHLHFDERGLGFLALGLAQGSQRPVAVIVTSGSAVANLLPAVVEARQSGIPLWLLTADRPAELIGNGANQAIEQTAIFSSYPIYQQLLPTPSHEIAPAWLLACVDQAAYQQQQTPGPVHLNFAFREPLYPVAGQQLPAHALRGLNRWFDNHEPWTRYTPAQAVSPTHSTWETVCRSKGVIVVGRLARHEDANAILQLAEQTDWPLLADIQSQLRFHPHAITYADLALHHPEFRAELAQAETLLLFGGRLISKRLQQFLTEHEWQHCWQIDSSAERLDNGLAVQQRFVSTISDWCQAHQLAPSSAAWHQLSAWDKKLTALIEQQLPNWGEITLCHQLNAQIQGQLFIGNSMPIRLLDMLGTTGSRPTHIYTNRGASGIDGLIATAAGIAKANPTQPITVLLGDTSALFDLNSLALLRSLNSPFVLIIINNDGGNIFHMLPVPEHSQIREHFYQLPHGLHFQASAEQFQLAYAAPTDAASFQHDYQQALTRHSATLVECKVAVGEAANWLKTFAQHVRELPA
jgi:2-succinyl-5-enolpyruvyl-6-hydroxy-3-cyclohexene-1-carboxylate synthase